jgi:diketogulonate reductase-like aldo/keto reductase
LLYLHWWDWTTGIEEVMDSLHILVEQGKVLYLGISDTPAWIVSAANTYAIAHGKTPFAVYQGRWNVLQRDFERDIIPMARHFGMALAPWDVLGGGKFQSKKAIEARKKANEGLRSIMGSGEQTEEEEKMSAALEKVAQEHGVESVTTIALAYVMQKAQYVFPIMGGRKVEHLHDNIKALSIHLTDKQIEALEGVKQFDIGFPMTFVGEVCLSIPFAFFLAILTINRTRASQGFKHRSLGVALKLHSSDMESQSDMNKCLVVTSFRLFASTSKHYLNGKGQGQGEQAGVLKSVNATITKRIMRPYSPPL